MRIKPSLRVQIGVVALVSATLLTACGGGDEGSALDHAKEGKLTVGIKFDQPGLGLR
ncbi:glutamate-binding protein, partial [Nocardia sp. NPDC003979]